jgi:hypothetical protein
VDGGAVRRHACVIIEWARNPSCSVGFRAESVIIGGVPCNDGGN